MYSLLSCVRVIKLIFVLDRYLLEGGEVTCSQLIASFGISSGLYKSAIVRMFSRLTIGRFKKSSMSRSDVRVNLELNVR